MIRSLWFWQQVSKVIPEWVLLLILIAIGVIGLICSLGEFMKDRKLSSLGWTLFAAFLVVVAVPMACDRQPSGPQQSNSTTPERPDPTPSVSAAKVEAKPPVDEAALEQDLRKRATSAANFLMEQMKQVADFRDTLCAVNKIEVIRQPNNISVPYIGRVVLRVSDNRLDYTGQLHLTFELQRHGWYLADIKPVDYRVGPTGAMASPGMMSTQDALPILRETHAEWIVHWKAAYALGKTRDTKEEKR
jgi:hypothetical protein